MGRLFDFRDHSKYKVKGMNKGVRDEVKSRT